MMSLIVLIAVAVLFALPWAPWAMYGIGAVVLSLMIYEMVRNHGNARKTIESVEEDLGVTSSTTSPAKQSPAILTGVTTQGATIPHI
jgi:hypothetical protein